MTATNDDRRFPPRPILTASVAVFRDGEVLLAQRGRPPARDLWSLPGGAVELGETLEEAALRELAEETGVTAEIVGPAGHVDIIRRDETGAVEAHYVVLALAARHLAGDPFPGDGTADVKWVRPDALDGLKLTVGLPPIVARAADLAGAHLPVGPDRR